MSALLATAWSSPCSAQTTGSGTASGLPGIGFSSSSLTAPLLPPPTSVSVSTSIPAAPSAPGESAAPPSPPWVLGDITARGLKNTKFSVIRDEIKARKGDLYDRPDLDRDVQSLLSLGSFERVGADVSSTTKPVPIQYKTISGSPTEVRLTFFVVEKPIIKTINFQGNKKLSRGALEDAIMLKTKDPLDLVKLHEDEAKILDKYHKKGFLDASVSSQVQTDTATLQSVITFSVSEGAKSRIAWVSVKGAHAFPLGKLIKQMKNKPKKVFVGKDLPEDIQKIDAFYKNNGYLDVHLSTPSVLVSLDKQSIYISLSVNEGRQYRFGDTSYSGNLVYTSTELAKAVEYHRGEIFNEGDFEDTIRAIQEMYAEKGHLRARVTPVKSLNPQTDLMDVHYGILEGDIIYVDHVDVDGNKATKTYVLKREITVKPGDVFKASKIRKSRERIMNLGFIDDVDIDIQSPTDPDKVDLTFDVSEGKPGVLTAGAAYSTVDGIIGTLSLQHMNLFGRAQRAAIQWSFGQRVLDYSVSWTTPWVDDHPTSLGVDLFNTRRINPFESTLYGYVEHNVGGSLRLAPRFEDDEYQLSFAYTGSVINVSNIDSSIPSSILTEGTSVQSSISMQFARDTRDNIWDPTTGSDNSIGWELSGGPLMGDVDYFKPSVSDSINFKLADIEDYPLVLTADNRAAYITPFGADKQVPVFNRFFLGGQDDLRGYEPTGEVGDPNGGNIFDVGNLELGFPLAREKRKTIVKFVVFFDAGGDWDTFSQVSGRVGTGSTDIKTDAGFGIRFTTPAFPIRLDWGYGFQHVPGEKRYQVNFGMGNLF